MICGRLLRFCTIIKNQKFQKFSTNVKPFWFHKDLDPEWGKKFESSFKIIENFINEEEESNLLAEVEKDLKRQHYQDNHWDNAIAVFRETEKKLWNKKNLPIIQRIRDFTFEPHQVPLPYTHVLDLAENGHIKPHVDSVRFCGDVLAVLSLLTDAVGRFVVEKDKTQIVDCFIPRRSLYIMGGSSRHDFTHEILSNEDVSNTSDLSVIKSRRVSIICRCQPNEDND